MDTRKKRFVRRLIFMLVFIIITYGGVIGLNRFMGAKFLKAMASMPEPTISVSVATAQVQTWPQEIQAVASLQAEQGTTLTTQSAGMVIGLYFKSGESVQKGQLLVQLNNNVARAQLAMDQAKLINAKQEVERQKRLFAHKATSQSALQAAEAAYSEAQASIQSDKATLTNLQVRAPFDGHLGIREVSLGQYVSPGTGVVDIQQWNPLRVEFNLPQSDLHKIAVEDDISLSVDGLSNKAFRGRIIALGSAVANDTRTFPVEAQVDNNKSELRPGMFGEATIRLAMSKQAIAVPVTAIDYNTYGKYVYVIKDTRKGKIADERIVHTAGTHNNLIDITYGVKPGEKVVIAGQVNLYPDAQVKIIPAPAGLTSPSMGAGIEP